jgi:ATP synthase protein I
MAVLAVVAAWVVAGSAASVSALVGAGAYWVPNTLFMLWLLAGIRYAGQASPYIFLLGEACKLGMTVLVLGLVVWFGREQIVWPALLAGLLCALKGHVLLLMLGKLP